jgi:hypothetical protein
MLLFAFVWPRIVLEIWLSAFETTLAGAWPLAVPACRGVDAQHAELYPATNLSVARAVNSRTNSLEGSPR